MAECCSGPYNRDIRPEVAGVIWFRPVKKGYRAGGGWQNAVPAHIIGIWGRRGWEWYSFGPKKRDFGLELVGMMWVRPEL